jgi:hypothetical protein
MKRTKSEFGEFEIEGNAQGESTVENLHVESVELKDEESKPALPVVQLKVFCSISGKKPDQIAGFVVYAKMKELKPMTIPEWQEELTAFQNKPTR